MQNHFPVPYGLRVIVHQPLNGQREQPIHTPVYKLISAAGLLVQKVRQSPLRQHVFPPDHGVAEENDSLWIINLLQTPLVQPVITAQTIRNTVIRGGFETFDSFPNTRSAEQ